MREVLFSIESFQNYVLQKTPKPLRILFTVVEVIVPIISEKEGDEFGS